jgi:tetratricopeptide (TPR) repeat protein
MSMARMTSQLLGTRLFVGVWIWISLAAIVTGEELKDAASYAQRGQELAAKGEVDKALADLTAAIRLEPEAFYYYVDRGLVWHRAGNYDKAIVDYNKAVQLESKSATAYIYRGCIWIRLKQTDKASNDFDEAVKLEPTNALAYRGRGAVKHARGDFNSAIAAYDHAIQIDPKDPDAYTDRSLSYAAKKQYDKALADDDHACRLDPTIGDGWNDRAWIEATCPNAKYRNGKKAVEHATKACQLAKWKDPAMLDTLAAAYAETGDFDAAVKWQTKARDLFPETEKHDSQSRLDLYRAHKPCRDGVK